MGKLERLDLVHDHDHVPMVSISPPFFTLLTEPCLPSRIHNDDDDDHVVFLIGEDDDYDKVYIPLGLNRSI